MTKQDLINEVNQLSSFQFTKTYILHLLNQLDEPLTHNQKTLTLIDDLKNIVAKNDPFKTVFCYVTIGKSKESIYYEFLASDFIRIENNCLLLKNDERRIKLDTGMISSVGNQMNGEKI